MTTSRTRFLIDFALFGAVAAVCGLAGGVLMNNMMQGNADMAGALLFASVPAAVGAALSQPARWCLARSPSLPAQLLIGAIIGALGGALVLVPLESPCNSVLRLLPYTSGGGAALASAVCPVYLAALELRGWRRVFGAVAVHIVLALAAFGVGGAMLFLGELYF